MKYIIIEGLTETHDALEEHEEDIVRYTTKYCTEKDFSASEFSLKQYK